MKRILLIILLFAFVKPLSALESEPGETAHASESLHIEKAERNLGCGWFKTKEFKAFIEPSISFVKRKADYSEVIEYSWRPLLIRDMPKKERIDRIRFSYNRYQYAGSRKQFFYGGGVGGHIILFTRKLKDWAQENVALDLKDGVNGLGRVFCGYKLREISIGKTVYPVVLRVDGFFSPAYEYGGRLGRAGEKLNLTEVKVALAFSIE